MESEEEAQDETENLKLFCSSCKQDGHLCHSCPKDPNVHSKSDSKIESARIKRNIRVKRKVGEVYSEMNSKLSKIMNQKFGDQAFGRESPRDTETTADQSFSIYEYVRTESNSSISPRSRINTSSSPTNRSEIIKSITPDLYAPKQKLSFDAFPSFSRKTNKMGSRYRLNR